MVKHIILWQLKDELTEEERAELLPKIKEGVEALVGVVPGLLGMTVTIDGLLPTSNVDWMLDATLEDAEALKTYATYPDHVAIGQSLIFPNIKSRTCIDYEIAE